ncbi:TPA: phage tail protein [Clostridium sporogenes]
MEQFYTLLTDIGKVKIANATALQKKLELSKIVLGDSNGSYYEPTEKQTKLRNKVWEGEISKKSIDEDNPNWIIVQTIIPSQIGGFTIREAGIIDSEGELVVVAKYPETYKPKVEDGSTKDITINLILEVSNVDNVTLKVDPTISLATKKDIENVQKDLEKNIKDIELTAADIKTSSGTTVESQLADITKEMKENFTCVSNGKRTLETAIIDKDGTVSKSKDVASFEELKNGIQSIKVGDYSIGDKILINNIKLDLELSLNEKLKDLAEPNTWCIFNLIDYEGNYYFIKGVKSSHRDKNDGIGKVYKYLSNGKKVWEYTLNSCFGNRQTMDMDRNGNLYLGTLDGRVIILNKNGSLVSSVKLSTLNDNLMPNAPVTALNLGELQEYIYVSRRHDNDGVDHYKVMDFFMFTLDLVIKWKDAYHGSYGIRVDKNRYMYSLYGSLYKYIPQSDYSKKPYDYGSGSYEYQTTETIWGNEIGMEVDKDWNIIIITDYNEYCIKLDGSNGKRLFTLDNNDNVSYNVQSVAVDRENNIYVGFNSNKIQKINKEGIKVWEKTLLGNGASDNCGLTLDKDDNLLLSTSYGYWRLMKQFYKILK